MGLTANNLGAVRLARSLKFFSQWDGWLIALGGGIVLVGWWLQNESLKRVIPGLVAMNPMTALGFIMGGLSLACFWRLEIGSKKLSIIGQLLSLLVACIGGFKLGEYVFGWRLLFDQWMFADQLRQEAGFSNQIAPNTAFNFLIGGVALWSLHFSRRSFSRWAQNLGLILLFVSLVPLVGYAYRVSFLYSIGSYIPMALHTAAFFCLLATGTILAQADHGVVMIFTSKTPGGVIARRLLPFAFGVPFLLGALTILAGNSHPQTAQLGVSIVVVGSFAAFSTLIWYNAMFLNRADDRRQEAETALRQAHDSLEKRVEERTARLHEVNRMMQGQIIQQQKAEEKIRDQAKLLDEAQDAILVLDMEHRMIFWNKGAERLYGWRTEEVIGKSADELFFTGAASNPAGFTKVLAEGGWDSELVQTTKASHPVTVESRWTLVKDKAGKAKCILIINTNITEKKNYETQLLRSQRMESLGALASGIAHDLNNALAPVIMGAELLMHTKDEQRQRLLLDTIYKSAKRGTEMVKQIVGFARGSQGQKGPVQVKGLLKEMEKILRDTFPKSIAIEATVDEPLQSVYGDATELHQVLLNLCVNARDAMPQGGQLILTARSVELEAPLPGTDALPGAYVLLTVTDTGSGIPADLLPRIFEPFFTTKTPDKGTGLGLSTVNNIVKNHEGFIKIKSESGQGTQFQVYLPALQITAADDLSKPTADLPVGHGELIMVMDDEQAVRQLAKNTLENYGYRVVTAPNGLLGITCFEEYKEEIRLIVSDTDMPFMDGLRALHSIQRLKPDVPIIIASGSKRDVEPSQQLDTTHLTTLSKPYTVEQLLTAVAAGIDSPHIITL